MRDMTGFEQLNAFDDEMDELHTSLVAEIVQSDLKTAVAIEAALVSRFYERLGDHAVNIAGRMRYVSGGPSSKHGGA
jgi:phosphate transport system protein